MERMQKCKVCNAEIAKSAKTCPSCGAKNKKPFFTKWWVWVVAVFVVIGIASNSSNKSQVSPQGNDNVAQTATKGSSVKSEATFNIGDTVKTDKFEITIISVEERMKIGTQYLNSKPADGGIYVAVKWEYKNISKEPIGTFSFPTIKLQDSNKTKYNSDMSASSYYATEIDPNRKILSDLNPGIKVIDGEIFEISKETYSQAGWQIIIDADKDSIVKIK
jgi:hypothetical protein